MFRTDKTNVRTKSENRFLTVCFFVAIYRPLEFRDSLIFAIAFFYFPRSSSGTGLTQKRFTMAMIYRCFQSVRAMLLFYTVRNSDDPLKAVNYSTPRLGGFCFLDSERSKNRFRTTPMFFILKYLKRHVNAGSQ